MDLLASQSQQVDGLHARSMEVLKGMEAGREESRQSIAELKEGRKASADLMSHVQRTMQALLEQQTVPSNPIGSSMAAAGIVPITLPQPQQEPPNPYPSPVSAPVSAPGLPDVSSAPIDIRKPIKTTSEGMLSGADTGDNVLLLGPLEEVVPNKAQNPIVNAVLLSRTSAAICPNQTQASLGKTLGLSESRPLDDAALLITPPLPDKGDGDSDNGSGSENGNNNSEEEGKGKGKGKGGGNKFDFERVFQKTADEEIKIWKNIVKHYTHDKSTVLSVSETSAQLGRVACLWVSVLYYVYVYVYLYLHLYLCLFSSFALTY